ncbi:MAG: hypothetical protein AB7P99_17940 [Vicinamibacterales bacterium]
MTRLLLVAALLAAPALSYAQDSKSQGAVGELVKLLDERKLDAIAAAQGDAFVGALYLPGSQLLVVRGRLAPPERAQYLILNKNYRDLYIDLNSASDNATRVFISDLGANGLRFRRDGDQPFDTADVAGRSYSFDGDWGRANLSRDDYTKAWQDADDQYTQMVQALLAELRKAS